MERSITFAGFWSAYIIQMRPYLLFVSGVAGSLGIALAAGESMPLWRCGVAFVSFFLAYGFGQALTDCFQTDTDKLSAPYRPLSQGIISIRSAMIVSIGGLLFCAVVLVLLNPLNGWLGTASMFGLATYSYIKRNLWFAGPFYNAWIVALLPVMGMLSGGGGIAMSPVTVLHCAAITFFSYANFVLIGYLKDIEADRQTGYRTFPVVFGWRNTIVAGDIIAIATMLFFWTAEIRGVAGWVCGLAGSIVVVAGLVQAHLTKKTNEIGALVPILSTVRSFVLLHIALILSAQPGLVVFAVVFYVLFEVALYVRPARYQV